ncbi:hypothetical protein [Terrabacter terrigena]|uniref:DUF4232 domain-containing protein n=1 Tax=Terrabacter terrigena TaxID=574718 RepID=A0ABW3N480_9MICO
MKPTQAITPTPRDLPHAPLHPRRCTARLAMLALGTVLVTGACGQASPSGSRATPAGHGGTASPAATASTSPAAGHSSSSGGPARQTVTVGGVRLEAEMAPAGAGIAASSGLLVEYSVTNTGSKPVVALDVVPDDLGSATVPKDVDPQHAWVYAESGVLRISKQGFATAPNVRFAAAPVMGGHTIAPGATITGRAYAAMPPKLDVPGESFVAPHALVDPALKQWQLCIQVDDHARGRPSAVGGGVVEVASTAPRGDQLACTAPATVPVS